MIRTTQIGRCNEYLQPVFHEISVSVRDTFGVTVRIRLGLLYGQVQGYS